MTETKKNINIKKIFARATVVVLSLGTMVALVSARSTGLKNPEPTARPANVVRAEKSTEKRGLRRHRLNEELVKNQASDVELELIDSLKSDPDGVVRQGAAQFLGNYVQNPAVVSALSEVLKTEKEPAVRYACVMSLGLSNSFRAMNTFEKLMGDPDVNLRRQLAASLKRQGNTRAKVLLQKLQNDSDQSVRAMAGGHK